MRVLVTGGNSFIDVHLLRALVAAGHSVTATLRSEAEARPPVDVPCLIASLEDAERWATVGHEVRPECVIHLAGLALVTHADASELYKTNVVGTDNLLKGLASVADLRPQVLLASTSGVYGNQAAPLIDETLPPRPANHYAVSKLAMEFLAFQHAERFPLRVLRPFNVVGPGQNETFLVPKLVKHHVERSAELQLGNLEPERDFIDVRDVARFVTRLIERPPEALDVVNLCSGVGTSIAQLLELLAQLTNHRPTITVNPQFVRKNEVWRIVGDNRKLSRLTGLNVQHTIRDTLEAMVGAPLR